VHGGSSTMRGVMVAVFVLPGLLVLLLLSGPTTAGLSHVGTPARRWDHHGVVFGGGEWSSTDAPLGSARADASLRAALESGASTIRLIPTWYTDSSPNSTKVYRTPQHTASQGPFATETDEGVAHTIELARSLGAKVILGPLLDPNYALPGVLRAGYPGPACLLWRSGKLNKFVTRRPANCSAEGDLPKMGRGPIGRYFTENQWKEWFSNYTAMMMAYARLAEKHGAETLIIAAELWAAMGHLQNEPRWRKLASQVRAVYSGKLAVAANAKSLIPWADAVDILGFDMYHPRVRRT
jgi:hypothetical protein